MQRLHRKGLEEIGESKKAHGMQQKVHVHYHHRGSYFVSDHHHCGRCHQKMIVMVLNILLIFAFCYNSFNRGSAMPQNDYMDLHKRRFGERLDAEEKRRKKDARKSKVIAKKAKTLKGIKAKLFNKERFKQKIQMKKTIKEHEEKNAKSRVDDIEEGAVPTYLMDR
jgi:hypothetical protein